MINQPRIEYLLQRWMDQRISAEEQQELATVLNTDSIQELLAQYIDQQVDEVSQTSQEKERILSAILQIDKHPHTIVKTAHRVHFLKTAWFRYAAAVIVCLGIGAYLWTSNHEDDRWATMYNNKGLQTDIASGGEKAVLTLADGTEIILDSAVNGNLAQQGSAQVVKLANGQIAYNVKEASDKDIMWNTMHTPAGGQYRLLLPDGSRVWLNAASSITYPAVFVSKNRQVKVTGEVYFEIAKNKEKPFVVDIDGKSTIEVLGTSFNVNSYKNEAEIKTTLVEGSVKVVTGNSMFNDKNYRSVILKPGQQAQIASGTNTNQDIIVSSNVNLDQALAWKNGLFNFDESDLYSVMRQLERWYDIKVQYQGSVSNVIFQGKMYRNVNLSTVLNFLQKMGVKFRMEEKTLIVY